MATLNVIYKIAADISGLQTGVNRAATAMESLDKKTSMVGQTLATAFTTTAVVGAIVTIGKVALDTADRLSKLSDRTGITAEQLQRLDSIAQSSGNSLEDVANAVNQFQKRLEEGGQPVVRAITSIGLSVASLKAMSPDEQFIAIAKAIQSIQEPAKQTQIAMELFGKSGAQLLPTLKADVDSLADATYKMSNSSVKALDDLGDAFGRAYTSVKNFAGEALGQLIFNLKTSELYMLAFVDYADSVAGAMEQATKKAPKLPTMAPIAASAMALDDALKELNKGLSEQARKADAASEASKRHREELARLEERVRSLNLAISKPLVVTEYNPAGSTSGVLAHLEQIRRVLGEWDAIKPGTKGLQAIGTAALEIAPPLDDVRRKVDGVALAAQNMAQAPRNIAGAFRRGFSDIAGILDNIGGKFAEIGSIAARTAGSIMDNLASGNVWGAVVAGVTGAVAAISKLWRKAEQDVNPVRQAFVDAAGGLDELNKRAHAAGVTLKAILDAKTPEQYKKAIDDLNRALQFQDDAMQTLEDTAKKYGLTIEELGPAFARQQLDKKAQELYKDFMVLTAAGVDIDTVILRMGDSINEFIHNALLTGTEIPAAMRPMIEAMIRMGKLTDENGNIITDLGESGIKFSETMSEGFTRVVKEVQKLTEAIIRGLGLAIDNIPQPVVHGRVVWDVDPVPEPGADPGTGEGPGGQDLPRVPQMANGGIALRPTLALIGEAGPEAVVPLNGRYPVQGGSDKALASEVAALRRQLSDQHTYFQAQFSRDMSRAMRDELQKITTVRR